MRKATRQIIVERPSEQYLLMMLLVSNVAFFMSWAMKAIIVPNETGGLSLFSIEIGLLFVFSFIGRTSLMYLFAGLVGSVCRVFGGRGTWRNTRIAVFWGAIVAAPFGILAAVASVIITNLGSYFPIFNADWISTPPYWLGMVPFFWFISDAVAKAHGFAKTLPVFIPMTGFALVVMICVMYLRAVGAI